MTAPKPKPIRALVAIASEPLRTVICRLLAHYRDVDVVACPTTGEETVAKALELRPDVIVIDARMPGLSGADAMQRIAERLPRTPIIGYAEPEAGFLLRAAGALNFVSTSASPSQLVEAIRSAAQRL